MSVIAQIKAIIETCPALKDFALRVNCRDNSGEGYSLFPAGDAVLYEDMAHVATRECKFVLQASRYTADDLMRLDNCDFVENFQRWISAQNRAGIALDGASFESIAASGGFFESWDDDDACGTYQIPCSVIYEKEG